MLRPIYSFIRYGIGILLVIIILFISNNVAFATSASRDDSIISNTYIEQTAGMYCKEKIVAILDDSGRQKYSNIKSDFRPTKLEVEKKIIEKHRRVLALAGVEYTDFRLDLNVTKQSVNTSGELEVETTENIELIYKDNGISTLSSAHHIFIYLKSGDAWVLSEDKELEGSNLMPNEEGQQFVDDELGYHNSAEDPSRSLSDNLIPEVPSDTNRTPEALSDKKYNKNSGYNYIAMAEYLETYCYNHNPGFRDFTKHGGDCTNFASQALFAGKWAFKKGLYSLSCYWWYGSEIQSTSWVNVSYLANFGLGSGRFKFLDNIWKLRIGDVLQVKPKGSSVKTHTVMVSYYYNGMPYLTYHSKDHYRQKLSDFMSYYPGATYYAYRT